MYDGKTFTNFRKKDGLGSNIVIYIKEDSYGRIWFFHFNGSLSFMHHDKICGSSTTNFLPLMESKEFFFDFFQDADSTLYFYNRYCEIATLDRKNTWKRYNLQSVLKQAHSGNPDDTPIIYLRRISKTVSGDFLLLTGQGYFTMKVLSDTPAYTPMKCKIFRAFPVDKNTQMIDPYTQKLLIFKSLQVVDSIRLPYSTASALTSVMMDEERHTWVADYHKGLYSLHRDTLLEHFDIQKPQSILQDHEGNIWVGSMSEGVYKINTHLLKHRHYPPGMFGNKGIVGLCKGSSGGVWLTNWSQVWLFRNKTFYNLPVADDKSYINLIFQMRNGSLVIGEKGSGFQVLKGITFDNTANRVRYRVAEKLPVPVTSIIEKSDGKEICASYGGLVYRSEPEKMFRGSTPFDAGHRNYCIFYDMNDSLILNNQKMLYIRNNQAVPFMTLARFNLRIITNHLLIGKTAELFDIEGDSIIIFDGKKTYNLTDAFDSPVNQQVIKLAYHEPSLYFATSSNVFRCDNPLGVTRHQKVHLRLLDINFRNIHDILVSNDSLFIASDDGLTVIPEVLIPGMTSQIPIPYLRSVTLNDYEMDLTGKDVQVRGISKIAFHFGAINYSSAPVMFEYKLEGLDTSWTSGNSENVVYQRLLSGNYVFKLKVRKATSEWSAAIDYPFVIKASFWRHPLFFAFILVLVLGLITILIIRRKNIQMKHRELDHHLVTLELKALQSMMNPHFIFNSLGSIQNFLLQNKTGEAGLYLSQFARLIRQNMNAINAAMINLDDEVDRLKNYLDLERLRMEDKFEYRIVIDENFDPEDMQIPSMIIQPFVENSIWHGIAALEERGLISIYISLPDEKSVKVVVEDNGIGIARASAYRSNNEKHLSLGMEMTRKRLELLGRKFSVETMVNCTDAFPGRINPGTRVTLTIPVSDVDPGHKQA
jgi:hypothetical protein